MKSTHMDKPTKPKRPSTVSEELCGWRTGIPSSFSKVISAWPKPSPTIRFDGLDRTRSQTSRYHLQRSTPRDNQAPPSARHLDCYAWESAKASDSVQCADAQHTVRIQ